MDLYDIHTHEVPSSDSDEGVPEHQVYNIINVYPLGFEDTKDNEQCHWFSCGIHPWYSDNAEPQLNFLKEIAGDNRIVAIGEAGLDKLKGPDLQIQQVIFEAQIRLSEILQKPLIIHNVKTWDNLLAIQKKHHPTQRWILHGYRGKPELTRQLIHHGFYFSIGDKFNADSLRIIPLDRLFCETDTSDIKISEVYLKVAETLNITFNELALQIQSNICDTFPQLHILTKKLESNFS